MNENAAEFDIQRDDVFGRIANRADLVSIGFEGVSFERRTPGIVALRA
jgi:hypothetical protein